jgi:hypothetical protein
VILMYPMFDLAYRRNENPVVARLLNESAERSGSLHWARFGAPGAAGTRFSSGLASPSCVAAPEP